jgi:hypothetical protein
VLLVLCNAGVFSIVMGQQNKEGREPMNPPGTYQIAVERNVVYLLDTGTAHVWTYGQTLDTLFGRRRMRVGIDVNDARANVRPE